MASRKRLTQVTVPACQDCGTCCFSLRPEHVRVWEVDSERMGSDNVRRYTAVVDGVRYMGMTRGCCDALEIDPESRRFCCAIYELRPDTCRALERGSSGCRDELIEKRERPVALIESMLR